MPHNPAARRSVTSEPRAPHAQYLEAEHGGYVTALEAALAKDNKIRNSLPYHR